MWATFLLALAGPLVKRALVAIGVGFISYAAVMTAFTAVQNAFLAQIGSAGAEIMWVVDRTGTSAAVGILLGAMAARLSLHAVTRFGKLQA